MNPNDEHDRPDDDVANSDDERQFEQLLSGLDRDAAEVDPDALARVGERAAAVFVGQDYTGENTGENTKENSMQATAVPHTLAPAPTLTQRHAAGLTRWAWRAVAAALLVAAGWSFYAARTTPDEQTSAFAEVLQNTAQADSLHLVVHRPQQRSEVWAQGRRLRWNVAEGQYLVGNGAKLWSVDQKTNHVRMQASPYYHADWQGLDVLAVLELGDRTSEVKRLLDEAEPDRVQKDGVQWQVYRAELRPDQSEKSQKENGPVRIEAFVDSRTGILHSVEAVAVRDGQPQMLGKVVVLAVNQPVDEQLFVVGNSLSEDGRVGKVTDMQGIVTLQPVMHRRWTPVETSMLLKPGDWIRTDSRGANAVTLRLQDQGDVTVGPGSLVELVNATQLRVTQGELQVATAKGQTIQLLGPDEQQIDIAGTAMYRIDQRTARLALVKNKPLWLQGYEGTVAHDSIGSLVAKIDGRDVPLTVGDHMVTVDIHDQIARTSIEESFVNHTNSRLEGVFYFPLPQDASISGFGMWIGGELIEADVVEKQRAREIYETILRERRDPGLLEWSGGNLFKARVFPIEAHSEKRIKITYTQVLPLERNRFRYSYALRSEMLQQHPLRNLKIDVKVSSLLPIKKIHSPTHTTRTDATANSGHVEFAAQEYTPRRDFEVVVELEGRQSDVVVIPHRRGEDGYFMLQLTPPTGGEGWQRDVLPDGEPLQLLVLADSSASMDNAAREKQSQVIAALLASLADDDTVNIATCDVDCRWLFTKPRPADPATIDKALDFVAGRQSLGWSDLDAAFDSVIEQSGPNTHVLYIGDGIVTTDLADPVAFAQRLREAYRTKKRGGAFHAISVSSTFESIALKAIASLGGGSFRQVSGEQGPQAVIKQLLSEIAQPAIRDLKVEFRDVSVAAVYPQQLPNLVAGAQQIVLGRYLPEGTDQVGEVIVTGTRDGKPVRFSSKIKLKDAEKGNSFIPRLWARMHLDQLLDQGDSAGIRDEIIAMSEEFHIITPYTSLLVLETDEDRERFKVKRHFLMRDGERFFAKGRDDVDYELVQKQMRLAGGWRIGLRRSVLRQLSGLGRDPSAFQQLIQNGFAIDRLMLGAKAGRSRGWGQLAGAGGRVPSSSNSRRLQLRSETEKASEVWHAVHDLNGPTDGDWRDESATKGTLGDEQMLVEDKQDAEFPQEESARGSHDSEEDLELLEDSESIFKELGRKRASRERFSMVSGEYKDNKREARSNYETWTHGYFGGLSAIRGGGKSKSRGDYYWHGHYGNWLGQLFPNVAAVPPEVPVKETEWPQEALELAASLLRIQSLRGLAGGVEITRRTESFDVRRDKISTATRVLEIYSPNRWLVRGATDGGQTQVQWCDAQQRGTYSVAFQLGRVRSSVPRDLQVPPLRLGDASLRSLDQSYPNYTVTIERPEPNRAVLTLKYPGNQKYELRFEIDTQRNVVRSRVTSSEGKVTSTTTYADFVEVAGTWWAQQIETTDAEGRRSSRSKQTVAGLDAGAVKQRIDQQLAGLDGVVLLPETEPSVAEAKSAIAAGKGTAADQIAMMQHFGRTQQWPRVWQHFQASEKLVPGKPGFRWVRYALQKIGRRNDPLKTSLMAEADLLTRPDGQPWASDAYFLAQYVYGQASGVLQANEMLDLLAKSRSVYFDQPEHVAGDRVWRTNHATYLESAGRRDEALEAWRKIAADYPHDVNSQTQYAQRLANASNYQAAYDHLRAAIDSDVAWLPHERNSLHSVYVNLLTRQGRYAEVVEVCATWIDGNPADSNPYRQYLGALIFSDQEAKAYELIEKWLQSARDNKQMSPADSARFQAAVYQALGRGTNFHQNYLDPRWLDPLAETVVNYAGDPLPFYMLGQIMSNYMFQRTDACRRVRSTLVERLLNNADTLSVQQIQNYVQWIVPNDPAVERPTWQRIADAIERRWSAAEKQSDRDQLAQTLNQFLASKIDAARWLTFLRKQLAAGPEINHHKYAMQLFNAILNQPWDQRLEDEAFSLFNQLADPKQPKSQLAVQVEALHRLASRMVTARYAAQMDGLEHPETLTRTELRTRQQEFLRLARERFAERLHKEEVQRDGAFAQWLHVERLYLLVQLQHDLDDVLRQCWKHLGEEPRPETEISQINDVLDNLLYGRYFVMAANLTARRTADDAARQRLLKFIDQGIAGGQGETFWKLAKFHLLVALDQPKPLEAALRTWIADAGAGPADAAKPAAEPAAADGPAPKGEQRVVAPGPDDPQPPQPPAKPLDVLAQQEQDLEKSLLANYWRVALAYLLAERGEIADGIALLEKVEAADELMPADYRTLADWYLVVDRREDHERALIEIYKTTDEHRLQGYLSRRLQPWQRRDGDLPTELDKKVLQVFRALFEKSTYPQNYLWQLRGFYTASRDFRLLAVLADAMVGQTAVKIYPFLNGMNSVLQEVRDEATADSIVQYLAEVRQRAETPVDRRALDLLEVQVERRAAEVLNQPGPHVAAAVAAMQRAFQREWSAGEPRLMAELLAGLGQISQKPLAAEQLRELQLLLGRSERGSLDRLHIAYHGSQALWYYDQTEPAIRQLDVALREYQQAIDGPLPDHVNSIVANYVSLLRQKDRFAQAETYLLGQLQRKNSQQQVYWYTLQLYEVYHEALEDKGAVSIGRGPDLYRALEAKLIADLATSDHNHRYSLFHVICRVYRTAHRHRIHRVAADLRTFAFTTSPPLLSRQTSNYASIVGTLADTVHDLIGPRDGLAFLIERIESEPSWLRFQHQDGWSQHAGRLGQWKRELKGRLGDLEPRLLAIVLKALQRDLREQRQRNRSMYTLRSGHFWSEKRHEFARVAENVHNETKRSGAAVVYVAEYLFYGLDLHDRAIQIMWQAQKQNRLDETGQSRLVSFLHHQQRFAESIDLLYGLIALRPDTIGYRGLLMHALYRTNRNNELLDVLAATDAHFHGASRWTESNMAALAASCLQNHLFQQSAAYYEEVIPLHQRTHNRRGIGEGTLSNYYASQALAYSGLKDTPRAVEAACGAIISWGPRHHNRSNAIASLNQVLRQSPDLAIYVKQLNRETEESGLDKPIVRKALGQVLLERRQPKKAAVQLQLALELQPHDAETHQALIACYEALGDRQRVIEQILAAVQLRRRDIQLYKDLAERLRGNPSRAERAATSIVEMLPNETESHSMLAEIRQEQGRWDDAILHWRRVAELRALEPTGLLKLAEAQVHEGHWDDARRSLTKLTARSWPVRFGDVHSQSRNLWRQVERQR